jgi:putative transposase
MLNHLHAIIIVGAQFIAPTANMSNESGKGAINRAPTLGEMERAYKAASAAMIRRAAAPDFAWQRNYYEHVIRRRGRPLCLP